LLDSDGGTNVLDQVDLWAFNLIEELAGIGREGFDVPPLTLSVYSVECERGFARTGEPGYADEGIVRKIEVESFKVVLSGLPNGEF